MEFFEYFSYNQRPKIYLNQSSKLKRENRCRPVLLQHNTLHYMLTNQSRFPGPQIKYTE